MDVAKNLFVRVTLQSGVAGYGEVAPFPDISGEDQASCLAAFPKAGRVFIGHPPTQYRQLFQDLKGQVLGSPALRCGIETAVLDALSREMKVPLWRFFGEKDVRPRETDVTLPIGNQEEVVAKALEWYEKGFRQLKMKVGQHVEEDIRRVEAVGKACPNVSFVIDANQGFSVAQAQYFMAAMERLQISVLVMEQPVHRDHVEDLIELKQHTQVPLAADESLRSLEDARDLIQQQAVDMFNIKITKCGVLESVEIIRLAQSSGMALMIGGMVESRIAMGCSWSLVNGLGGFEILDLDMPLLLAVDPVAGGYRYEGSQLHVCDAPGLGVEVSTTASSIVTIDS